MIISNTQTQELYYQHHYSISFPATQSINNLFPRPRLELSEVDIEMGKYSKETEILPCITVPCRKNATSTLAWETSIPRIYPFAFDSIQYHSSTTLGHIQYQASHPEATPDNI